MSFKSNPIKTIILFAGISFILFAIGAIIAFYFLEIKGIKKDILNTDSMISKDSKLNIKTARLLLEKQDDLDLAIKTAREVLFTERYMPDRASTQLILGSALLKKWSDIPGKEGQAYTEEGIGILVDVIKNQEYEKGYRYSAATGLASETLYYTLGGHSPDFLSRVGKRILEIDPTINLMDGSDVYRKLLDKSIEIEPNSFAYYSKAGPQLYLGEILQDIPLEEKREIAKKMQDLIAKGDAIATSTQMRSPSVIVAGALFRARGLTGSNRVLNNLDLDKIADAYKYTIKEGTREEYRDNATVKYYTNLARFFYANFLLEFYKDKRIDEAKEVMVPFGLITIADQSVAATKTREFFISTVPGEAKGVLKQNIINRVALVSPEFKNFIKLLGI